MAYVANDTFGQRPDIATMQNMLQGQPGRPPGMLAAPPQMTSPMPAQGGQAVPPAMPLAPPIQAPQMQPQSQGPAPDFFQRNAAMLMQMGLAGLGAPRDQWGAQAAQGASMGMAADLKKRKEDREEEDLQRKRQSQALAAQALSRLVDNRPDIAEAIRGNPEAATQLFAAYQSHFDKLADNDRADRALKSLESDRASTADRAERALRAQEAERQSAADRWNQDFKWKTSPEANETPDQKNYRLEQNDPNFRQRELDMKRAGAMTVDQRQPTAEAQAYGSEMGKAAAGVVQAGEKANANLYELNRMGQILKQANAGKLNPSLTSMSSWGKALGVDDSTLQSLGLDPKAAASSQAVQGLINHRLTGMLGPGGFPSQNFSNADSKFLQEILPSLESMPEANQIKIQALQRVEQRNLQKAQAWMEYKRAHKGQENAGYDDFSYEWAKQSQGQNLFDDLAAPAQQLVQRAGAPEALVPPQPGGVPGAPAPKMRIYDTKGNPVQ